MQKLFLQANVWSQQVLTKMAWERNMISLSSPTVLEPGAVSYIEWLWKSAAQLPLSSSFQMWVAFLCDCCGNGFSLWEQSLPPQCISPFLISHRKLPERGSWTGVACRELTGDGCLRAVRRKGKKRVVPLHLRTRWREPLHGGVLSPFCPK